MSAWYDILNLLVNPFENIFRVSSWISGNEYSDPATTVADLLDISEADRKKFVSQFSDIPIVGDLWKYMDRNKQIDDYMNSTGLTWEDVKYPALFGSAGNNIINMIRPGANFVSANISSLYSDKKKKRTNRK